MKKLSKKEIRSKVKEAMTGAIQQLDIAPPTKKTKKLLSKVSWKISGQLKEQVKKRLKKEEKAAKSSENGKASKKQKTELTKID